MHERIFLKGKYIIKKKKQTTVKTKKTNSPSDRDKRWGHLLSRLAGVPCFTVDLRLVYWAALTLQLIGLFGCGVIGGLWFRIKGQHNEETMPAGWKTHYWSFLKPKFSASPQPTRKGCLYVKGNSAFQAASHVFTQPGICTKHTSCVCNFY